jgi:YHS domain-containing protein
MSQQPKELGALIDRCDVCEVPLEDLSQAVTQEYGGKIFSFCSVACQSKYVEDPSAHSMFEEDQGLE